MKIKPQLNFSYCITFSNVYQLNQKFNKVKKVHKNINFSQITEKDLIHYIIAFSQSKNKNKSFITYHMLESTYITRTIQIPGYMIFIDTQLGSGASGVVFKGQSIKTKQYVAIKRICRTKVKQSYKYTALQREKTIMGLLRNPHTVQLVDIVEDQSFVYIALELCEQSLQNRLIKLKIPDEERQAYSIGLLTQLANGLFSMVKQNIIHRDLKPDNILIKNQVLKIGDYGYAKQLVSINTEIQSNVGTPYYQPKQLLFGQSYTMKYDVWSLGIIFYQILHGDKPWPSADRKCLVKNILTKPLQVKESFSSKSKDFVKRCLALKQKDRMEWKDVFQHEIFQGFFNKQSNQTPYKLKLKLFMEGAKKNIKQNIFLNSKAILENSLKLLNQPEMKFQNYFSFLKKINNKITLELALYIFRQTDTDFSDSISIQQIYEFFQKYGINLKQQQKIEIPIKSKKMLQRLIRLINKNGVISIDNIFQTFNKQKKGRMNFDEFKKLLLILDKDVRNDEIRKIFQLIDEDMSQSIELEQITKFIKMFEIQQNKSNKL